jgi:hypothetical protein
MNSKRIEQMTARLFFSILAGEKFDYLFSTTFNVVRQNARDFKTDQEEHARIFWSLI